MVKVLFVINTTNRRKIEMNYKRIYNEIIENAISQNRERNEETYYESHHILPKSLGGSDDNDNLVLLTGREHFLCHWLLYRMNNGDAKMKMGHAFFMMTISSKDQKRNTSRLYEYAKIAKSKATSLQFKGKSLTEKQKQRRKGSNNPRARKVIINSIEFGTISECALFYKTTPSVIRRYLNEGLEYRWLVDAEYRRYCGNREQAEKIRGKNKGKSYVDIYGEEKAKELIEKRRLSRLGNKLSNDTKKRISLSRIGKPSPNKGKTSSDDTRKKISEARQGKSITYKQYKVIDPNNNEYLVSEGGLRKFWRDTFDCCIPNVFKSVKDIKVGKKGKWRDWKVYVL